MRANTRREIVPPIKRLLIFTSCFLAFLLCGGATARTSASPKTPEADTGKIEVRNNAASLLANILGNEKNVSKILIIKRHSPELGRLIKAISKTAGDGSAQLETLAKNDKTLNLHTLQLPPGETATRAAILKTKEHELLFSSGEKFEINLLLSQTDALDYASHLAKIAAENAPSPEQQHRFHALDVALNSLLHEVVAMIRKVPAN